MYKPPFQDLERFTGPIEMGGFASVNQVKEKPEVVVKEILALDLPNKYETKYTFAQYKEELLHSKETLQPLIDRGFIPDFKLVFGEGSYDDKSGYIVMPRVTGLNLEDISNLGDRVAEELDNHLAHTLSLETLRPPDILCFTVNGPELRGIVVGTKVGDKEDHPYLVDVYPLGRWRNKEKYFRDMLEAVEGLERKSNNYIYAQTRKTIQEKLNNQDFSSESN